MTKVWNDIALERLNHHVAFPILIMCSRSVGFLIVTLALLHVSPPAFAQSQMCMSLEDEPRNTVKKLFEYSQLAERHIDRTVDEPIGCPDDNTTMHVPDVQMSLIEVPSYWAVERFKDAFDENYRMWLQELGIQSGGEVFVDPTSADTRSNMLRVVCQDQFFPFDAGIEMRFYRRTTGADVVQLKVVGRPPNDSNAEWVVPEIDSDGIITLPGTTWSKRWSEQAISNFAGEYCGFPAVNFVVDAICAGAIQAREKEESFWLNVDENEKLTLVGHSLGGAAAQFIATSSLSQKGNDNWSFCPGVDAYAFGSIGLKEPQRRALRKTVRGTLTSYASECDGLTQILFPGNVQAGHLFTLSNTEKHLIDDIQDDLCNCLRHQGNHQFIDRSGAASLPRNMSLCPSGDHSPISP